MWKFECYRPICRGHATISSCAIKTGSCRQQYSKCGTVLHRLSTTTPRVASQRYRTASDSVGNAAVRSLRAHAQQGDSTAERGSPERPLPNGIQATAKLEEAPVWQLAQTQELVETSLLAALAGLVFAIANLAKLESYFGYFLPLPTVMAGMRMGWRATFSCVSTTGLLLLVLLGPMRALSYVLVHGLVAACVGALWVRHTPWLVSVTVGSLMRCVGVVSYLAVSSWALNDNLFGLLLVSGSHLLDQVYMAIGISGEPSSLFIGVVIGSLLVVNSLFYVFFMHIVLAALLRSMDYKSANIPQYVQRGLNVTE